MSTGGVEGGGKGPPSFPPFSLQGTMPTSYDPTPGPGFLANVSSIVT